MHPLLAALLVLVTLAPGGMRTYRSKETIVKSNAPAAEAKALGKRIDHYCGLFNEFYAELGLKKKSNNTLKIRLFETYDEYAEYYKRGGAGLGGTPLAYFSASLNSIVMYSDEQDVALRAVVFHESSHQFLNRYTNSAPRWLNEGLAEFFEGWKVPDEGPRIVRPHLYDVALVQQALERDVYLTPRELTELSSKEFIDFAEMRTDLHGYMHYATAWSVVYYSLMTEHAEDRARMRQFLHDLRDKGDNAEFVVDDWDAFTERWKTFVQALDPTLIDATDHFLVATGFRTNREWKKAAAALEQALEADPELPSARYWLGYSYKRMGDYPNARKALDQVLVETPDDPRAPYYLARMALGIDNKRVEPDGAKALEYAEAASELVDDQSPTYLLLIARCHLALGDGRQAKRAAKKILKVVEKEDRESWQRVVDEIEDQAG